MSKKRGKQHTKEWRERRRQGSSQRQPKPRTVKITARSTETLALDEPLRFPIPPTASGFDPQTARYWWGLIQYGTDVPDPRAFPPLGLAAFSTDERKVLERFVSTTERLASSAVLTQEIGMTVNVGEGGIQEEVVENIPPFDAVAGFSVLLRQCYAPDERASFKKVMDILWQVVARTDGSEEAARHDFLARWRKAVGGTQARSVQNQAIKALIRRGVIGDDPDLERYPDSDTPERLLSDYFYGDTIHWDKKAEVVEQREQDAVTSAFFRHDFFNAAAGFAHLYIGFAALITVALEEQ